MKNTAKTCELDSSGYEINADAYNKLTKALAELRDIFKDSLKKKFDLVLDEPINPKQLVILEKTK